MLGTHLAGQEGAEGSTESRAVSCQPGMEGSRAVSDLSLERKGRERAAVGGNGHGNGNGNGNGPLCGIPHPNPSAPAAFGRRDIWVGVTQWETGERHLAGGPVPPFGTAGRPWVVAEQSSWCWISPGISPAPLGSPFPTVCTSLPSSPFEDIF